MYFWLNYSEKGKQSPWNNSSCYENIDHLFCMTSEKFESDELLMFLFSDGTQINNNEHLKSLENAAELYRGTNA